MRQARSAKRPLASDRAEFLPRAFETKAMTRIDCTSVTPIVVKKPPDITLTKTSSKARGAVSDGFEVIIRQAATVRAQAPRPSSGVTIGPESPSTWPADRRRPTVAASLVTNDSAPQANTAQRPMKRAQSWWCGVWQATQMSTGPDRPQAHTGHWMTVELESTKAPPRERD